MDPIKKEALLEKRAMSYKEMSTSEKEASLERNRSNMRHKYHAMAPSDKKELKVLRDLQQMLIYNQFLITTNV